MYHQQDPQQYPQYATSGMLGGKKKRNRKRKNKEGKLTAEEIHSMPTDDLCNYIENKANQNNEAAGLNGVVGINVPHGSRGAYKIKKRAPGHLGGAQNNSSMSIED